MHYIVWMHCQHVALQLEAKSGVLGVYLSHSSLAQFYHDFLLAQ